MSRSGHGKWMPLGALMVLTLGLGAAGPVIAAGDKALGASVYKKVCQGCHEIGVLGAPRTGSKEDWAPRLKKGKDVLVRNAIKGVGSMPPKGGGADLKDSEVRAAVDYLVDPGNAPAATTEPSKVAAKEAPKAAKVKEERGAPNRFNRLLTPVGKRNPPPAEDGIHDPENEGTLMLQSPREAFKGMPKSTAGNYVEWVKALEQKEIAPRFDRLDPNKKPMLMDLNIVREVKGSMPDVVYPHKPHLEWLDCSNCHPAIFEPKKGANQISMAEILLGQKCGVCHGKVAFPVAECRRCHSRPKSAEAAASKTKK